MGSGPKFPHIDILFSTVSSFLQTFGQLMLHFVWDVGYLTMLHQKIGKKIKHCHIDKSDPELQSNKYPFSTDFQSKFESNISQRCHDVVSCFVRLCAISSTTQIGKDFGDGIMKGIFAEIQWAVQYTLNPDQHKGECFTMEPKYRIICDL
jgi:hypothetical protein